MATPILSILIINYKTPDLTKLCLRLLRKHTDLSKVKIIVVDNDSADESLEYLRKLSWITLIERKKLPGELPANMHASALDLAFSRVDTPYVLSIHTDTLVLSDGWLEYLLGEIEKSPEIAGVGSWKLESVSPWKKLGKSLEKFFQTRVLYPLSGRKDGGMIAGEGKNYYYLRSHCALYRTDLVRKYTQGFFDNDTAGKTLHKSLVEKGYKMVFLPTEDLMKYIRHLNHATMILNPEISGRKTGTPAARRRVEKELNAFDFRSILADDSLDVSGGNQ